MRGGSLTEIVEQWQKWAMIELDAAFTRWILRVYERILELSPVSSGDFRAAWVISIGTSGSGAQGAIPAIKFGDLVYIENLLPYGPTIEFGGWKELGQVNIPRPVYAGRGRVVGYRTRTTPEGYSTQAPRGILHVIQDEAPLYWAEEERGLIAKGVLKAVS